MKLLQLINSEKQLQELAEVKFKARKAFEVLSFLKNSTKEVQQFHEVRNSKVKELGKEVDGVILVTSENTEQFIKEINELLDKEIVLVLPELTILDFGDEKVSTELLASLGWLIK